jgi:hypothetical protein
VTNPDADVIAFDAFLNSASIRSISANVLLTCSLTAAAGLIFARGGFWEAASSSAY